MIPKIIHYCWFGKNPLPELAIKCINSWKKYFPDYEIKEWNEYNFDVNIIPYTREAYRVKKYAFVSDYARFWILYNYGGIYFDTDVEVIKPMNDIIADGSFMGCERRVEMYRDGKPLIYVNPGLALGAVPGLELYKEMLEMYSSLHFISSNGALNVKTVVQYTTEVLSKYGLVAVDEIQKCKGILVYPPEYFCPITYENGKMNQTINTYTIHHFAASWLSPQQRMILFIKSILGVKFSHQCSKVYKVLFKRK